MFGRWGKRLGRDDSGVTAVEYVVIMGFLAAMIFPFAMKAATNLWGGPAQMGSSTSVVGRGPYNYPDGPVVGSEKMVQILGGNSSYVYLGLIANNGNLTMQVAAYDAVHDITAPVRSGTFSPNGLVAIYVPETGGTVFMGAKLPTDAGYPPAMTLRDMAKYPISNTNWTAPGY